MVAGTQADTASRNEILVMKASSLHKTQNDDGKFQLSPKDRSRGVTLGFRSDVLRHLAV
jgi:hypothetical protein